LNLDTPTLFMIELKPKLQSILLIDDDDITNFYNSHLLRKMNVAEAIHEELNGRAALDYLEKAPHQPDLVFLDINMPVMNGFEFLEGYNKMAATRNETFLIMMLTSSLSPLDKSRAAQFSTVTDYYPKPLSVEKLTEIFLKYFPERIVR
jgi:CheY-like chemotaxis protein